uniref:Uncharacterized protein n=1 Tax=Panagrolaimus sp. ES5 TaxID=591445 RepID=A0AC34GUV3_9BILA
MHIESVFVGIVQSIEQDFKDNLASERRKSIGIDKQRSSLTNGGIDGGGAETTIFLTMPEGERRVLSGGGNMNSSDGKSL